MNTSRHTQSIDRIVHADHYDPFEVLGFHLLDEESRTSVIRTVQPAASQMFLVTGDSRREMYRTRQEGLYEIVINDCVEPFDYMFETTYYDGTRHAFRDPYRYLPLLSDFDRHLFNNGTHYEIYNRLGAHPTVIEGVDGTVFRVWAPNARRVSVLGNFNYWDARVHQMRILGESGIWELFIPGVKSGEAYKFEIRSQEMQIIEKADPFQFFAELRPKSASIVWDIGGYEWRDEEWLRQRQESSTHRKPMSTYEVHLGSWRRDPNDPSRFLTYGELAEHLIPYVKEMGFTHIELMPVMEHPLDESWGYQVTGYFAVTSRHGTPQEFMYFVDQCHLNGIGVILDWVPSHFPMDGHALGRFDGTALYEHEDPRQGTHPEWGTHIFNYGRKEVQNFLIANAIFWFERYHIDGLRVDAVASMLYLDYARPEGQWIPNTSGGRENIEAIEFLKHLNTIVYDRYPGIMMIAEESTSFFGVSKPANLGGLGFGYKWNMGWMNDTLDYFSRDPIYRKYNHNALTFSLLYAFSENFILPLSHDEVVHGKRSLIGKMPGDEWQRFANLRVLFCNFWCHPGKKLLFMGGEFAQFSEWYCKISLDWHLPEQFPLHRQMQDFVRELNHFYKNTLPLWEIDYSFEGFSWMDFRDVDNSIVSFARFAENRDDHVVCLFNFTPQVINGYRVGVPQRRNYREVFNSDLPRFGGSGKVNHELLHAHDAPFGEAPFHVTVTVPPLAGIILKPE